LAALFFATSLGLTFLARLNQAPEVTFQSFTPIEPSGGPAKEGEGKGSLLDQLQKMEDQTSQQPALPPGVTLPGQSGPAAPQTGQSLMQKGPAAPQGTNLPLPALPAAPLGAAAPAPVQPLPLKAEPSPQGQPVPK
jgi:preprotein translocase subunit SecG